MPRHWLGGHALFLPPLVDQDECQGRHKLLPFRQLPNAVVVDSDYLSVHQSDQTQRKFREKG